MEGINGGEKTAASQSRGHRRGPSGWGGCTRQRGTWGGVETIGGGLQQAVRGGSRRSEWNGSGSPNMGSPASACGPQRFRAPVRSSGWCQGVQRGTGVAFCGGSMKAARWRSGGEGVEEEKGSSRGGVLLL
jgi:hypothetical protein